MSDEMDTSVPGLRPLHKLLHGKWDFKMTTKLRATSNRIIVSPEPPVTQEGRFYVQNLLPSNQGTVISVGPGDWHRNKRGRIKEQRRVPVEVKVGHRISFKPFGGTEIEYEGQKFRVIAPDEVLLVLD